MDKIIITEADGGIRLDRWFKRHYPGLQHAWLEKNLRKGLIRVGGKKAKSSDRVEIGQVVDIKCPMPDVTKNSPNPESRILNPDDIRMIQNAVLYKDANLIVLGKPYGLAVQGGSKIVKSIDGMLDALRDGGKERPKLVHRLDRDTSGCLVLARSAKVATAIMHLFSSRRVEKTYWALVNNAPLPPEGVINLPLLKKENPKASGRAGGPEGRDYEIVQVNEEGQKATTEYRVIDQLARKFALVEMKPLTGRMHQLRVHMSAIGCPIVGDHKYGGGTEDARSLGVENILHLHARRIVIPALPGGKKVDVLAPLPDHMRRSFKALGLDVPKK